MTQPPVGLERFLEALKKARANGLSWALTRVCEEAINPTSRFSWLWRSILIGVIGGFLRAVAYPVRALLGNHEVVTVFYDLSVSPITFDAVWAVVMGDHIREKSKAASVHVVIVPGPYFGVRKEDDSYEIEVDSIARHWRLSHIVLPLFRLCPSVRSVTMCESRKQATMLRSVCRGEVYPATYWPAFPLAHRPNDLIKLADARIKIALPLRANAQALRYVDRWLSERLRDRKCVVITLRQYSYSPKRNSDLSAWLAFAERIDKGKYFPVFVPDTESTIDFTLGVFDKFPCLPEAAWNLDLRMALYERAYLNLMVNNGPHGLCMFSDQCRYLMFKIITPEAPQTTEKYMQSLGFTIGSQPSFSKWYQRWVWSDDSLEVIEREFGQMARLIDEADLALGNGDLGGNTGEGFQT